MELMKNIELFFFLLLDMTENNFLGEQFMDLWKENEELRLKISHDKQRKKEYKQKLETFKILVNDASVKLNEGSDLIKKLQQNLKLCQEKVIYFI